MILYFIEEKREKGKKGNWEMSRQPNGNPRIYEEDEEEKARHEMGFLIDSYEGREYRLMYCVAFPKKPADPKKKKGGKDD